MYASLMARRGLLRLRMIQTPLFGMEQGDWVVLAGGGASAVGWTLANAPWDLMEASDGVIGISAGAVALALKAVGANELHVSAVVQGHDILASLKARIRDMHGARRWLPGLIDPQLMSDTFRDLGVGDEWPAGPVYIAVTEIPWMRPLLLDRTSGIPFVTAVTASAAIPGVFIPVRHGDRLYVDGGVRSTTGLGMVPEGARSIVLVDPLWTLPADASRVLTRRWETHRSALQDEVDARPDGVVKVVAPSAGDAAVIWRHPLHVGSEPGGRRSEILEHMRETVRVHYRAAADRALQSKCFGRP